MARYTRDVTSPALLIAALAVLTHAAPTALVDATPGWLGDLAFDSKRNRWLVVSHSGSVYGRLMGNDGKPVGETFVVSGPGHKENWSPLAAYAPDADRYLVVWMDFSVGPAMHGRFLSGAGAPGEPFEIALADVPGVGFLNVGGDRTSALRYDAPNRRFVLVWEHREPGFKTKLTTIDLEGRRGKVVEVGGSAGQGNWGPAVAVNEAKGEYCVAYDQRNTRRLAVTRLDAKTLAAEKESVLPLTTTNVDIAYNAKSRKYLLIYDAGYGDGVRGRFLSACDLAGAGDVLILPKQGYASVAANPYSGAFAAIGQDGQDFGNFYSVVDAGGKKLARQNPFTQSVKGNFLPVIRANTKDGTFAATSSRDYAMTRFVARIGSGEGVAEETSEPEEPKHLGWAWEHPASGQTVSGVVELIGRATPDVTRVDFLLNLKKVGEAEPVGGRWRAELDAAQLHGGLNLSALIFDADGASARYTIRINVPGAAHAAD